MRLLLTGVTGVAGLSIYRAALADPAISHITVLSRRPIPSWAVLPSDASSKTTTILHTDFLTYPPDLAKRLAENDACVWALGKSAVGMSEEEYTTMTHGFLMAAVRALHDAGVGEGREEGNSFRFVFISGESSDQTEKSQMMWARIKGRAEKDLIEFCKASAGMKAHVFRPAYFCPSPKYPQDRLHQRSFMYRTFDRVMPTIMSCVAPSMWTPVEDLSRFSVGLAKGRWPEQDLYRNSEMRELVKQI
ncbi:hypothetical protein WOLCODRAFT_124211 [Wolfiporia cocos MD-104 SS10]|uniref:NAD(P)-binding domain-containing protein n=1 Tax=Wolfiporia cocos (strain MD-104) TaxID=742152 RepID=A0A2H3JRQ9_WOLCO|nr:hypothetical protein WOLCODRAFT_124211 [Wolfiporia cocos MD-104 SS10]